MKEALINQIFNINKLYVCPPLLHQLKYSLMRIQTKNLTKKYGQREVVKGIDLDIKPGQILGLLGPNGAGKSTTIQMLTGQTLPTTGQIIVDDKEFSSISESLRKNIGVMPQDIILWDDLSVKENLEFSARMQNMPEHKIQARSKELIKALALEKELTTLAKNLSGGFKRRLNLAISIIHNPSVVFLDEPTPGIDPQNRRFLWDFIASLKEENRAVVLTDHYLEEAEKLSDYVVIIDEGKVIAEGTVNQLKQKHGTRNIVEVSLDEDILEENTKKDSKFLDKLKTKFESNSQIANTLRIFSDNGIAAIKYILEEAEKENTTLHSVAIKETSLEDVFLILTGKSIRE